MKQKDIFAFFDVDGTIIRCNSLLDFLRYFLEANFGSKEANIRLLQYEEMIKNVDVQYSREKLNELYYTNFAGVKETTLRHFGLQWFNTIVENAIMFNQAVLTRLRQHQNTGHTVVFVSGGFFATLDNLAHYLNVEQILCVTPLINNGILTGAINLDSQTIGDGKAQAIQQFLTKYGFVAQEQLDHVLSNCYAYGDHLSDSAMLSAVGTAYVVGSDMAMVALAKQKHWQIIF